MKFKMRLSLRSEGTYRTFEGRRNNSNDNLRRERGWAGELASNMSNELRTVALTSKRGQFSLEAAWLQANSEKII